MTFDLGDTDKITQVKVYVNITNESGKMQSAQYNSMQTQVCTVRFTKIVKVQ